MHRQFLHVEARDRSRRSIYLGREGKALRSPPYWWWPGRGQGRKAVRFLWKAGVGSRAERMPEGDDYERRKRRVADGQCAQPLS